MDYVVCSFYDLKADDFGIPFHVPTRDMALRLFQDIVLHKTDDMMYRYRGDFFLYVLGTYDSSSGSLKSLPKPERVCSGEDAFFMSFTGGAAVGGISPLKSQSAESVVSAVSGMEVSNG